MTVNTRPLMIHDATDEVISDPLMYAGYGQIGVLIYQHVLLQTGGKPITPDATRRARWGHGCMTAVCPPPGAPYVFICCMSPPGPAVFICAKPRCVTATSGSGEGDGHHMEKSTDPTVC